MQNTITINIKFTLIVLLIICFNKVSAQAPSITSFSPTFGSIGTLVTIIGTNLNNLDTIKIGGVSAIKISSKTDTLVAMVMPGTTTGTIYLTNANGNATSGAIFTKAASTPPMSQQGNKLVGTAAIGNSTQGCSVALSADGKTAIVGGNGDNNNVGGAWIYTCNGGTWTQQGGKLVGNGALSSGSWQGNVALSADGNTAMVGGQGDGAVWVYTRTGNTWTQQGSKLVAPGINEFGFGISVAMSADGNVAVVGIPYEDTTQIGGAYIFTRNGGIWTQQGSKLVGTAAIGNSSQGGSVSISADGNTVIVGGNGDNSNVGAAWIYARSGGVWTQQGNKLVSTGASGYNIYQGSSVSLSADGNTAVVGGSGDNNGIGAAWVYNRSGGTWNQQGGKLVGICAGVIDIYQGISVSLSADGNTALVGGSGDNNYIGAAWVFTRIGNTWAQKGSKLFGSSAIGMSAQGGSVSLSADGNTAIVGGRGDNGGIGAAWVYSSTELTISAFLEAFDVGNYTMIASPFMANGISPTDIADTITVELHEATAPYNFAYSIKTTLSTSGVANISIPVGAIGNSYYLVLKHRNSVETWSANPILISASISYDFTISANQAYGSNMSHLSNGKFAIYSGDINHDGSVDFNDYPDMDLSSSAGALGYLPYDLNGDASVDFNDYPIIDKNSSNGVIAITP